MNANTQEEVGLLEAFMVVAELFGALGVTDARNVEGCIEHQINDQWFVALNGHSEPCVCSKSNIPVEPFTIYVEFNGWPAGVLNPYDGCIAAGELANETTFIAAVKESIRTLIGDKE